MQKHKGSRDPASRRLNTLLSHAPEQLPLVFTGWRLHSVRFLHLHHLVHCRATGLLLRIYVHAHPAGGRHLVIAFRHMSTPGIDQLELNIIKYPTGGGPHRGRCHRRAALLLCVEPLQSHLL